MLKADHIKIYAATAAILALCLMALCLLVVALARPAEAAFLGNNGLIAFVSNRDAGAGEIYTMKPDGTGTIRITFPTGGNADPAFSPDGTKIAFRSGSRTNYEISVMNADGSGRVQLTDTSSAEQEPAWSPDGQKIAFVANSFDVDGQTDLEIWTMNADGTGRTQVTNNAFPDTQPAWSPDGARIAFVSARTGDTNRNVYVMDADGSDQTSITPNSPAGCSSNCYGGHDDDPTWSPDGQKIAYVHGYGPPSNPFAGGGLPNIWTMDPTGANKTNVSNDPDVSAVTPAYSPDGARIVFVGATGTNRDIWMMDADGTDPRVVQANAAHDTSPDWQQDSLPPETKITSGPTGTTGSASAGFAFVSSDTHSTFECSLDGAPYSPCASNKKLLRPDERPPHLLGAGHRRRGQHGRHPRDAHLDRRHRAAEHGHNLRAFGGPHQEHLGELRVLRRGRLQVPVQPRRRRLRLVRIPEVLRGPPERGAQLPGSRRGRRREHGPHPGCPFVDG